MNKLLIPEKIKVGYQSRSDTYTKKLAYIIYYDTTGKLRKEKSWKSWCDAKIKSEEFENKPHSGFVLNKGVQRYGHWSSGRSMVRVYDDRGMEFEITVANLMFILMTTDCLKRGLEGEFVYAWNGTELILLPTGCEEYQESQSFTALQSKKIGVKDLIAGASYKTKQMQDLIYLGRFDWYEMSYIRNVGYGQLKKPKSFVFCHAGKEKRSDPFISLTGLSSLAAINSDVPVSNYAELMDEFNSSDHSSYIAGLSHKPIEVDLVADDNHWYTVRDMKRKKNDRYAENFFLQEGDMYIEFGINSNRGYNYSTGKYNTEGWTLNVQYVHCMQNGLYRKLWYQRHEAIKGFPTFSKIYTLDELKALNFVRVKTILNNGKQGYLKD